MSLVAGADIRRDIAGLVRPALRISVTDACSKYVNVRSASGGIDKWNAALTPYMIEPMNALTSRKYEAVIFIGPAQSGKTQGLVTGFAAYIIKCDPADFMILQTSRETARDFDMQVVKRLFRDSPELKKELAPGTKSDNTFDKVFRAGNILFQAWPTINKLSGKPLKYVLLTDYDRMTQDIDKEGSPFSLSSKRTAKFLSAGMTLVETSPGFEVKDPQWKPRFKHEAPPCDGALSLFNMGDMRRWYVECPVCKEYYMPPPDQRGLDFAHTRDIFEVTNTQLTRKVSFVCAKNGCLIDISHKRAMNKAGIWVAEGQSVVDGKIIGTAHKSRIASFWFPGIFAAYSNVESMVQRYLNGCREYDITGSEQNLKTCINVDFGAAYLPRRLRASVNAEDYSSRSEDLARRKIPLGVLFYVIAVDVQSWGWVVQVVGYGVNFERWIIDRYDIRISKRVENGESIPADPAAYLEDWDLLTDRVLASSYELDDKSGRVMLPLVTVCDSGGKSGVTARAYDYWRKLRRERKHRQFMLVKGERPKIDSQNAEVRKSFPENASKNKKMANARGEIPIWLLNTTKLKDAVFSDLSRTRHGSGYIHFPEWLKPSFYDELTVEVRTEHGWDNPLSKRNESFDLICYADAGYKARMTDARMLSINWDKPPAWAAEWDSNSNVYHDDQKFPDKPVEQGQLFQPAKESEFVNNGRNKPSSKPRKSGGFVNSWR